MLFTKLSEYLKVDAPTLNYLTVFRPVLPPLLPPPLRARVTIGARELERERGRKGGRRKEQTILPRLTLHFWFLDGTGWVGEEEGGGRRKGD